MPKVDVSAISINFVFWDVCMHKCVMHFLIFWNQICMWKLTVDSKMHDKRSMLFFIETGKLWCILYSSKRYIPIQYPLPGLVYFFLMSVYYFHAEPGFIFFSFKTLQIQISHLPPWSGPTLFSSLLVNTCSLITDKNLGEIQCIVYKTISQLHCISEEMHHTFMHAHIPTHN